MARAGEILGGIVSFIAMVLFIVGISTTRWHYYTSEQSSSENGLWVSCYSANLYDLISYGSCNELPWSVDPIAIFSTRVLIIIAIVFWGIGLLLDLAALVGSSSSRSGVLTGAGVMVGIGGFFTLAACAAYTALNATGVYSVYNIADLVAGTNTANNSFGYSLYVTYVAGFLFFVSGISFCAAGCSNDTPMQVVPMQMQQQQQQQQQQMQAQPVLQYQMMDPYGNILPATVSQPPQAPQNYLSSSS